MTLSPSSIASHATSAFFRKAGAVSIALMYTAATFGALATPTAAEARGTSAYYTAELASPAKEARSIIRGVVWHCEGTTCRAAKTNSRPIIACGRLANKVGEIKSFTAKGKALADDKLAKCND